MSRSELPKLLAHQRLLSGQSGGPVRPEKGRVHVEARRPRWLLDHSPSFSVLFYEMRTPASYETGAKFRIAPEGGMVPCPARTCRRWAEAAVAYATAVDDVSTELVAAHRHAWTLPGWRLVATRRALRAWEQARRRYEEVMREAGEEYKPVRLEIGQAIEAEMSEKVRHEEREARARRHRAELARRAVWGWTMTTKGRPTAYLFRHDIPAGDGAEATPAREDPSVDPHELRRALKELKPDRLEWDPAAVVATERELDGVSFGGWWRELFGEDHLTFTTPPPPPPKRHGYTGGGTATGGVGGFVGGFGGGY
ncbi:hypothetical protein ACFVQ4_27315 [Streptomyces laurentii]|uniref:hypothetical protein n=1 Tax=Streptomyces laurentii TaxID=39478 RepID=UPI0036B7BFA4